LQNSLSEAKDACTIAELGGKNWDIQHVDEMGVRRILLGWYASESFSEFATTLLASIRDADSDGELLLTLETYLDANCSPTETATSLNIHRNTVINRVERLRSLLRVDLNEPDERLALQLACRVVKRKWED
jgi:DNA-binding PucR family transcriptional regulator